MPRHDIDSIYSSENLDFITILREPEDRLISNIEFAKNIHILTHYKKFDLGDIKYSDLLNMDVNEILNFAKHSEKNKSESQ